MNLTRNYIFKWRGKGETGKLDFYCLKEIMQMTLRHKSN